MNPEQKATEQVLHYDHIQDKWHTVQVRADSEVFTALKGGGVGLKYDKLRIVYKLLDHSHLTNKGNPMEFNHYIRKPFTVKAVEITEENIEEIAQLIGELRTKGDDKFIALDRRLVPNVSRAWVGWWVTLLGDNYRCYSPKIFKDQFTDHYDTLTFSFPIDLTSDDADPHGIPKPEVPLLAESVSADS